MIRSVGLFNMLARDERESAGARGSAPTLRRAGERGLLIEVDEDQVESLAAWLAVGPLADSIEDLVPAQRTVLVRARGRLDEIAALVRTHEWAGVPPGTAGGVLKLPISYDGPDLDEVGRQLGMERDRVIALHSGVEHRVAHFGFSPGFPYLAGSPASLRIPRRGTPRTAIVPGSVAIAAGFTVIYPGGTPGGWNIIGTVEPPRFWDIDRTPPNLLALGDRIVFEPVE
jgi:5-oxoprolinase (ATP-hydrolysing) subunit B